VSDEKRPPGVSPVTWEVPPHEGAILPPAPDVSIGDTPLSATVVWVFLQARQVARRRHTAAHGPSAPYVPQATPCPALDIINLTLEKDSTIFNALVMAVPAVERV